MVKKLEVEGRDSYHSHTCMCLYLLYYSQNTSSPHTVHFKGHKPKYAVSETTFTQRFTDSS